MNEVQYQDWLKLIKFSLTDYVATSALGLDANISLQNAEFQLDRVASAWACSLV